MNRLRLGCTACSVTSSVMPSEMGPKSRNVASGFEWSTHPLHRSSRLPVVPSYLQVQHEYPIHSEIQDKIRLSIPSPAASDCWSSRSQLEMRSFGVVSSLVEVGGEGREWRRSSRTRSRLKKRPSYPLCLTSYCRAKEERHCKFDKIPDSHFKQLVRWSGKYNRGLCDCAYTTPF